MFTSQGLKHDKARRRKAAEEAKAAAAADREAAAKLAIAKEEEEERAEEVEMSAVNEGFVDGVEGGSGEDSTAVGGGEDTMPKSFYGFPPPTGPRPSFFGADEDGPRLPTPVRPLRWKRIGINR